MFFVTVMEWSGFVSLWDSVMGHVGSSGGCRATCSLGTRWEFGTGSDGCVGRPGFWVFPLDTDSDTVRCWLTWTGPRGLT